MLTFVGLGLNGYRGMSLRALDACGEADSIFLERYTSPTHIDIDDLEETLGKEVRVLSRENLEEGGSLLDESLSSNVVLLSPGDPLIATTHTSILLESRLRGVKTRVLHAASVYSAAIGESGLHAYKFGRSATITSGRDFVPYSAYDCVLDNRRRGCHTLLLLQDDIDSGERLSANEALDLLHRMEVAREEGIMTEGSWVMVLSGLESPTKRIFAGRFDEARTEEFPDQPTVLVIPGKLHFTEEEALETLSRGDEGA
ncbi:MAG: diphthine synthase [Candidatus Geothermarchaeales archaeon]